MDRYIWLSFYEMEHKKSQILQYNSNSPHFWGCYDLKNPSCVFFLIFYIVYVCFFVWGSISLYSLGWFKILHLSLPSAVITDTCYHVFLLTTSGTLWTSYLSFVYWIYKFSFHVIIKTVLCSSYPPKTWACRTGVVLHLRPSWFFVGCCLGWVLQKHDIEQSRGLHRLLFNITFLVSTSDFTSPPL